MLQGMLYPKLDASKRTLISKGISMIPGVGDISDSATQILIASAELTRNCLGIAGMIGLLLLVSIPMIKLLVYGLGMKVTSSVLVILGEKKISELVSDMGDAQLFFLRLLFCEAALIMISLAVIAMGTR